MGDDADHSVIEVSHSAIDVTVRFADGHAVRANRFWLRDNCPSNGERTALFRTFTADEIASDLTIIDAAGDGDGVAISFDDGTRDRFDVAWLRQHATPTTPTASWTARHADQPLTGFSFEILEPDGRHHFELLDTVDRSGCALVTDVPTGPAGSAAAAALLGPVRETDFGRMFDIVSEPTPFTPSQSSTALDPHTDDPYRYTPSGVSMLHCVTPSDGAGGESIVVDGFAIADAIRRSSPAAFEQLTTVTVPFVHRRDESVDQGAAVHLVAEAPIIATDADGSPCGIRFHERSMGCLDLGADDAERFYPALIEFSRMVRSGEFETRHRLRVGEALVYDNQRVLHGRTAFDGAQSRRHLRLCTVDRDQVHSRLRRLRATFAPGTEHDRLTAGNLS